MQRRILDAKSEHYSIGIWKDTRLLARVTKGASIGQHHPTNTAPQLLGKRAAKSIEFGTQSDFAALTAGLLWDRASCIKTLFYYAATRFAFLRRPIRPRPKSPAPKSATEAGSGTSTTALVNVKSSMKT